ncbi:MAG: hypothetical protein E7Z91_02400 [Cyanobacteria bacterium SIG30]|nr:hypothetical protein [Cyanobacteria bacterium SIG30]
MKKMLSILAMLAITPFACASILEGTTSDVDILRKTNFSESAVRIVDTVKHNNDYTKSQYNRAYSPDAPEDKKKHLGFWYTRVKAWFDPMADDHYFGEHEINFDNKFFQMEPNQAIYGKRYKEQKAREKMDREQTYENL